MRRFALYNANGQQLPKVNPPPKFKRKMRVRVNAPDPYGNGRPHWAHGKTGTVLNPNNFHTHTNGLFVRYVTVRMDTQMEYERGLAVEEHNLELITDGETQYTQRRYDIRSVPHAAIEDIKNAILAAPFTTERRDELLGLLPTLRYK